MAHLRPRRDPSGFLSEASSTAAHFGDCDASRRLSEVSSCKRNSRRGSRLSLLITSSDNMGTKVPFPSPTPITPLTPTHARQASEVTFAGLRPAPSPSAQYSFSHRYANSFQTYQTDVGLEIPRFKKRSLNLGIVRGHGTHGRWQTAAWIGLWVAWVGNGLLSAFFDVNAMYMLTQVASHPGTLSLSSRAWAFLAAAYALCWAASALVWLAWGAGFQFYRRWRASRPAVEPLYLSLYGSVHLSLSSFDHFCFLLHIRLSSWGTAHALDIIPETAHLLIQLLPTLLPVAGRASIAIVLLLQGGAISASAALSPLNPNFFTTTRLTSYAKGVLLASCAMVAFRLLLVLLAGATLLLFLARPLLPSRHWSSSETLVTAGNVKRDPASSPFPANSWRDETELQWAWRERARARIQDAFQLCLVRPRSQTLDKLLPQVPPPAHRRGGSAPTVLDFASQSHEHGPPSPSWDQIVSRPRSTASKSSKTSGVPKGEVGSAGAAGLQREPEAGRERKQPHSQTTSGSRAVERRRKKESTAPLSFVASSGVNASVKDGFGGDIVELGALCRGEIGPNALYRGISFGPDLTRVTEVTEPNSRHDSMSPRLSKSPRHLSASPLHLLASTPILSRSGNTSTNGFGPGLGSHDWAHASSPSLGDGSSVPGASGSLVSLPIASPLTPNFPPPHPLDAATDPHATITPKGRVSFGLYRVSSHASHASHHSRSRSQGSRLSKTYSFGTFGNTLSMTDPLAGVSLSVDAGVDPIGDDTFEFLDDTLNWSKDDIEVSGVGPAAIAVIESMPRGSAFFGDLTPPRPSRLGSMADIRHSTPPAQTTVTPPRPSASRQLSLISVDLPSPPPLGESASRVPSESPSFSLDVVDLTPPRSLCSPHSSTSHSRPRGYRGVGTPLESSDETINEADLFYAAPHSSPSKSRPTPSPLAAGSEDHALSEGHRDFDPKTSPASHSDTLKARGTLSRRMSGTDDSFVQTHGTVNDAGKESPGSQGSNSTPVARPPNSKSSLGPRRGSPWKTPGTWSGSGASTPTVSRVPESSPVLDQDGPWRAPASGPHSPSSSWRADPAVKAGALAPPAEIRLAQTGSKTSPFTPLSALLGVNSGSALAPAAEILPAQGHTAFHSAPPTGTGSVRKRRPAGLHLHPGLHSSAPVPLPPPPPEPSSSSADVPPPLPSSFSRGYRGKVTRGAMPWRDERAD